MEQKKTYTPDSAPLCFERAFIMLFISSEFRLILPNSLDFFCGGSPWEDCLRLSVFSCDEYSAENKQKYKYLETMEAIWTWQDNARNIKSKLKLLTIS